jgi:hypothetical protein
VPHKRFISKLKCYSISDQITNWITSFLANRTQAVLLENTTSEKIAVTSGYKMLLIPGVPSYY